MSNPMISSHAHLLGFFFFFFSVLMALGLLAWSDSTRLKKEKEKVNRWLKNPSSVAVKSKNSRGRRIGAKVSKTRGLNS